MNFQQLEYAIALHQHKHFGLAADSCNVTQATLSGMIKKLEAEVGIIIFDRTHKPVQTTQQGETFILKAKEILDRRTELYTIDNKSKALEGDISIGVIPTIASSLLPIVLPVILNDNPKLNLTIREITTDEIKKELSLDNIDLGILASPLEDDRFEEHVLYYEPMMIYGSDSDSKQYLSSNDIKNKNIWLLEEGHCFRAQALTICDMKAKEVGTKNLTFKGSSFETLLSLSDQFNGYTLIPELYYLSLPDVKKNKCKYFKQPVPVREVSLISYRKESYSKTILYLSEVIKSLVPDKLYTSKLKNSEIDVIGF